MNSRKLCPICKRRRATRGKLMCGKCRKAMRAYLAGRKWLEAKASAELAK